MNLNGRNSKSRTILNGRPLYGYDRKKELDEKRHEKWHRQSSYESRTMIADTKMNHLSKKKIRYRGSNNSMIFILIIFILVFLFMMNGLVSLVFSIIR